MLCSSDTVTDSSEDSDTSSSSPIPCSNASWPRSVSFHPETEAEPEPPCYSKVLLESHLDLANKFQGLYPTELHETIKDLIENIAPTPHPYRTYHKLRKDAFDGPGLYNGELDPKVRRHGFGHMAYDNGDQYRGQWRKGHREGLGTYFWAESGSVYHGAWKTDQQWGQGHFAFGSQRNRKKTEPRYGFCRSVYSGQFVKGKMTSHGRALVLSQTGQVFEEVWDQKCSN